MNKFNGALCCLMIVFATLLFSGDISAMSIGGSPSEVQLTEINELSIENDMPVGGWSPMEAHKVDQDVKVEQSGISRSRNVFNSTVDSVFTNGSGTNGYKALSKDKQRNFYMQINTAAVNFMQASYDLQTTQLIASSVTYDVYVVSQLNYSELGLTKDEAFQAFCAYDYDHPGYYWISNQYWWSDECIYLCTEKEYASVSYRNSINSKIIDGVKKYTALTEELDNTFDKITLIHDQIVLDVDYAYEEDGTTPVSAKWAHSVQGVFDSAYSKVVCEGYSDAFSLMMNYLDIPNYYIVGTAGSGGGHAWNAVSDNGGISYMYMDLTWDDLGNSGFYYRYFGMPKSDFEKTHFAYTPANSGSKWLYKIVGDFYDDIEHTYYYKAGLYCSNSSDHTVFADGIRAKVYSFESVFSYMSESTDIRNHVAWELELSYYSTYTIEYLNKDYYVTIINNNSKIDLSNADINLKTNKYKYTGEEVIPEIDMVALNGIKLTQEKNYIVSYEDNTAPGEDTAIVIIEGVGHFVGECRETFSIEGDYIGEENVLLSCTEYIYDGVIKKPEVLVTIDGKTLVENEDYMVEYSDDMINPGTVIVTITGMGAYQGIIEKYYTIEPISISDYSMTIEEDTWIYDGKQKKPMVSLKNGDMIISPDNYTVTYENNKNVGNDAKVIVTGVGYYTGSCVASFSIEKADIQNTEMALSQNDFVYNRTVQKPNVTLENNEIRLIENIDYTILWPSDLLNVGTKEITIMGIGNYEGEISNVEYNIVPKEVTIVGIKADDKTYDGTTDATLDYSGVNVNNCGIIDGDVVSVKADAAFVDADAGYDKTVIISNITLTGIDSGNYKLSSLGQQEIDSADIFPKTVTITALDQTVYLNEDIVHSISCAVLSNALENHELTYIEFITSGTDVLTDSGSIIPGNAVIMDGDDNVTANYDINYVYGVLAVKKKECSITYTWSDDGKACVAKATYSLGEIVEENAVVKGMVTREATCKDKGITTYTASFTNEIFTTQEKNVSDIPLSTVHTSAPAVKENELSATCENNGSYDEVVYCSECGIEISRSTIVVEAPGHDYKEVAGSGKVATCTESGKETDKKCSRCGNLIKGNVIDAKGHDWGEWTVKIPATETEEGLEERICLRDASHTETRTISKLSHTHKLEQVEATSASCVDVGNVEYWKCKECGRLFLDKDGKIEISVEDTIIAKVEHTPAQVVKENMLQATCENSGSYDEVVYCSVCGEEISRRAVTVEALGHDWGEWTVKVPATGATEGLEERKCSRDASHTETRNIAKLDKEAGDNNDSSSTEIPNSSEKPISEEMSTDKNTSADITTSTEATPTPYKTDTSTESVDTSEVKKQPTEKGTIHKDENAMATFIVISSPDEEAAVAYETISGVTSKVVTIPESILIDDITYKVTEIAEKSFADNKDIEKVVITDNIKSIGAEAFSGCTNLKSVTIPASVKKIADGAFKGCKKLKNFTIGSEVTEIGDNAFADCQTLTRVIIPAKVTMIGKNAFKGNKKLKIIIIKSKKVKKIGKGAFKNINKKATIYVPKSLSKKQFAKYKKMFKNAGIPKSVKIKKK